MKLEKKRFYPEMFNLENSHEQIAILKGFYFPEGFTFKWHWHNY